MALNPQRIAHLYLWCDFQAEVWAVLPGARCNTEPRSGAWRAIASNGHWIRLEADHTWVYGTHPNCAGQRGATLREAMAAIA